MGLATTETTYEHIEIDPEGVPIVAGTNMKLIELVLSQRSYGWSPEELHFQFPYLSMGQIHSALAYYWDHQDDLDQDIKKRLRKVESIQQEHTPTPFQNRLKKERT